MGTIGLSQKTYLQKVLWRFSMDGNIKTISTSLASHFKLSAALSLSTNEEYMSRVSYQSAVESLIYAIVCTRPNLSQAINIVNCYIHAPGKQHWQAIRLILRYIYGTMDMGMQFTMDDNRGLHLVGYVDSDYVRD